MPVNRKQSREIKQIKNNDKRENCERAGSQMDIRAEISNSRVRFANSDACSID